MRRRGESGFSPLLSLLLLVLQGFLLLSSLFNRLLVMWCEPHTVIIISVTCQPSEMEKDGWVAQKERIGRRWENSRGEYVTLERKYDIRWFKPYLSLTHSPPSSHSKRVKQPMGVGLLNLPIFALFSNKNSLRTLPLTQYKHTITLGVMCASNSRRLLDGW